MTEPMTKYEFRGWRVVPGADGAPEMSPEFPLEFAPEDRRTPELCLEAVGSSGWNMQFVPETLKTKEMCLESVRQDGMALVFIARDDRTSELCMEAVCHGGNAVDVPERIWTVDMAKAAVARNGDALHFVPNAIAEAVKDSEDGEEQATRPS